MQRVLSARVLVRSIRELVHLGDIFEDFSVSDGSFDVIERLKFVVRHIASLDRKGVRG
jgi:hypothetical protein